MPKEKLRGLHFCIISLDERKLEKGVCEKCKPHISVSPDVEFVTLGGGIRKKCQRVSTYENKWHREWLIFMSPPHNMIQGSLRY